MYKINKQHKKMFSIFVFYATENTQHKMKRMLKKKEIMYE